MKARLIVTILLLCAFAHGQWNNELEIVSFMPIPILGTNIWYIEWFSYCGVNYYIQASISNTYFDIYGPVVGEGFRETTQAYFEYNSNSACFRIREE